MESGLLSLLGREAEPPPGGLQRPTSPEPSSEATFEKPKHFEDSPDRWDRKEVCQELPGM